MESLLFVSLIWMIFILAPCSQCAIIPNQKINNNIEGNDIQGYIVVRPNATLILRSVLENPANALQEMMLFKTILNAIRMVSTNSGHTLHGMSVKIYGEGVEHKFPPFLENIIQRIQTYFSVYRYTDTSEPLRDKYKPTLSYNESEYETIDVNLSGDHKNKTNAANATKKPNVSKKPPTISNTKKPTTTRTPGTTTTKQRITTHDTSTVTMPLHTSKANASQNFVENEFIEIKRNSRETNIITIG